MQNYQQNSKRKKSPFKTLVRGKYPPWVVKGFFKKPYEVEGEKDILKYIDDPKWTIQLFPKSGKRVQIKIKDGTTEAVTKNGKSIDLDPEMSTALKHHFKDFQIILGFLCKDRLYVSEARNYFRSKSFWERWVKVKENYFISPHISVLINYSWHQAVARADASTTPAFIYIGCNMRDLDTIVHLGR